MDFCCFDGIFSVILLLQIGNDENLRNCILIFWLKG